VKKKQLKEEKKHQLRKEEKNITKNIDKLKFK